MLKIVFIATLSVLILWLLMINRIVNPDVLLKKKVFDIQPDMLQVVAWDVQGATITITAKDFERNFSHSFYVHPKYGIDYHIGKNGEFELIDRKSGLSILIGKVTEENRKSESSQFAHYVIAISQSTKISFKKLKSIIPYYSPPTFTLMSSGGGMYYASYLTLTLRGDDGAKLKLEVDFVKTGTKEKVLFTVE